MSAELDDRIKRAMQENDRVSGGQFDRPLFEMIGETFRGRHRWLTAIVWISTLVLTVAWFWCIYSLFVVEETREQILFAVGVIFFGLGIALNKMWYWMLLNRNSVIREVKRLELQVARLAARLDETDDAGG